VFKRTALVMKTNECGSIDVLDRTGLRVAQINICLGDDTLIVDTIDVDNMWPERMLVTFRSPTSRDQILKAGTVNSVDFRRPAKVEDAKTKAQGAWDNWTDEDRKTEGRVGALARTFCGKCGEEIIGEYARLPTNVPCHPKCAVSRVLKPCPSCKSGPGDLHLSGCDLETCALCGGQMIACGCNAHTDDYVREVTKLGGRLPWAGDTQGVAECVEWGWYASRGFRPLSNASSGTVAEMVESWIPCERTDPGAVPDLNRLATEARWDRKQRRFVKS
jgi:hypothetical protein